MSVLVVYYSLEGNTKFIAEKIAKDINADIVELKVSKEYPKEGFGKYFWGGKSVIFSETPKLINEAINLNKYETIIIGTPVWANSFAPPINSFIKEYEIKGKQIAVFVCQKASGAKSCISKIKKLIPENNFIGEEVFIEPKEDKDQNAFKADKWVKNLTI